MRIDTVPPVSVWGTLIKTKLDITKSKIESEMNYQAHLHACKKDENVNGRKSQCNIRKDNASEIDNNDEKINDKSYEEVLAQIIREIFASEDMQEYLCGRIRDLKKWQIIKMIGGALIALERKKDFFNELTRYEKLEKELEEFEDLMDESRIKKDTYTGRYEEIDQALRELEDLEDGIFLLSKYKRREHEDLLVETIPFDSYKGLKMELEEMSKENEEDVCTCPKWCLIEKYKKNDEGVLKAVCEYLFIEGMVCYFTRRDKVNDHLLWPEPDLNLPVPFKMGDLISVNPQPFCGEKKALVLEIGDNWDCCSVQIAYMHRGRIRTAALKHGSQIYDWDLSINPSPLYCIQKCNVEDLSDEDNVLYDLQFILKNYADSVKRDLAYEQKLIVE